MAVVGRLIVQIAADVSALRKDMQKAADEIRRSFDGIRNAALSVAGVIGVAFSANAMKDFLVESAKAEANLNALRRTMRAVAGDADYGDALLDWVKQLANDLAVPTENAIELTKQMVAATAQSKELRGEGTERMLKATLQVAAGMQLSAAKTDQFALALIQIIGTGRLATEELNQLRDALPQGQQVLAQVAQEFGFIDKNATDAVAALREFISTPGNTIPAGILVPYLERLSKSLGDLDRSKVTGFTQELTRLGNAWTDFRVAFSQTAGLEQFFSAATSAVEQFVIGLIKGLQDPNTAIAQLAATIKDLGQQFLAWLQSIDNAKIESWIKSTKDWIASFKGLAISIGETITKLDGLKQSAEDLFSLDPSKWFRKTTSADAFGMKGGLLSILDSLSGGDWIKKVKKDLDRMGFTATPTITVKPILKIEETDSAKRFEAMKGLTLTPTVAIKPILKLENAGGTWQAKFKSMSADVQAALQSAAQKYELPLSVLVAIAWQESGGKQYNSLGELLKNKTSGATGVMQIMPSTALSLRIDAGNLEQNVMGGAKLLRDLLDKFNGDLDKSLKAYGGFVTKDASGYINNIKSMAGLTGQFTQQATAAASATQNFGNKLGEATKPYAEFMTKTATSFAAWTSALSAQKIDIPTEVLDKIGLMKEGYEALYQAQKQSADMGNESLKAQLDTAEKLKTIGTNLVDIANQRAKLQADIAAGSATAAEQDRNLAAAQAQLATNMQQVIDQYIAERDAASGMSQVNELLAERREEIQQTITAAGQQYAVEVLLTKAQEAEAAGNTTLAESYRQRVVDMEAAAEAARVEAELIAMMIKLRKELAAAGKGTEIDWDAVTQQIRGVAQAAGEAKAQQLRYSQALDKMRQDTQTLADDLLDIAKSAASSLESAFSDFFFGIMQGDMDDLADKFKKTLDRMVADMMARQLSQYLFGDFAKTGQGGGLFGGLIEWFKRQGSGGSIFDALFGSTRNAPPKLDLGGTEAIAQQATGWFESLKSIFTGGFGSFFGWLGSTITSLFSGLSSTLSGLLSSLTGMFSGAGGGGLFSSIGSLFSSLFGGIGSFFSGLFGFHQGGPVQAVVANVIPFPQKFHSGGPVSPVRAVANVLPFPKLHSGGAATGLKSDELVAVLQKRELVLTETQQRAVQEMIDPARITTPEQRKVLEWLPEYHSGGRVTQPITKPITLIPELHQGGPAHPSRALASVIPLPKLHTGGTATGLKPDELVAVLRERELVLTESQQRAVRDMIDPAKAATAATAEQKQVLEWLPRFHAGGMVADTARVGYIDPIGTDAERYTPTATRQWGEGASAGNTSVVVNVNTPDANSFRRSEAQIAAQMSRAIATAGRRNR